MKVLLINPEMPPSYWTFRELCRFGGHKTLAPPLGLVTVAAFLPRQWEVRLKDLNARRLSEAEWDWADMVMLSGMIIQRRNLLALVREAKRRGKTVVVGGPYPTSLSEEVLEAGCDFLVRGEAENTLPLLLQALREGQTGGVWENKEKPDLSTSPVPRFDLLNLEDYSILAIQTSRGCPFDCEFCDVVSLYGRKPRYKEPHQVMAELEAIYRLGWRGEIFVCDDNFIGNKVHARQILNRLILWMESHGQPFSFLTQTSVDLGQDLEMVDLMTRANFGRVFIGIETPDEEVLAQSGKYQNIRHPLAESLNNITANGLGVIGSFIIGFDGEKEGAGERICALVEATGIPIVMLNNLQAMPNTRLWQRLEKEGRLPESSFNGDVTGVKPNYLPTRPEAQIMAEYFQVWDYLYEPSRFMARAYRYILAMRPTRRASAKSQGKPLTKGPPRSRIPLRERLMALRRFLSLSWQQGGRSRYRWQYWRQLLGVRRKNPSRLVKYLVICAMGEDMFHLRETMRQLAAGPGRSNPEKG